MVTEEQLPAVQREPCHVSELPVLCITEIRSPHCNVKKPLPWSWAWTTIPVLRRPRQEDRQFEAILGYK